MQVRQPHVKNQRKKFNENGIQEDSRRTDNKKVREMAEKNAN